MSIAICSGVCQWPFRIHNRIVLWAKKYIFFSYKLKTNKLKPKNSEGELHSFISYWTFCQDLVRQYMQISVPRNVYVAAILNSLYTYGRSAKTKRKDKFSGKYVRVHWHLYKLLNSSKLTLQPWFWPFQAKRAGKLSIVTGSVSSSVADSTGDPHFEIEKIYSGTPSIRTPTGPAQVSVLTGCPY